ncbi:hypothetical protein F4678DRAFT_451153 [Xylaria arbuscula]|nr:hypothetical protein F4678DRAFT_451153 [Xylaria arbuscula]
MGDPFSMATGAIGIVSLGIQVCGGVSEYLSAVKHRNEELAAAWDSARTQAANFEWLDEFITRIRAERPEDANHLLRRLEDARGPVNKLRDVVAALAGLPPGMVPTLQNAAGSSLSTITKSTGGIKEKAREVGRAMTYKFHQDSVKDLQKALQHVSISLQTAMLNVMLNENEKQGHDVKSLQANVLSVGLMVESKGADIFSAIASLASQNQAMVSVVQQNEAMLREIRDSQSLLRDEFSQGLPLLAELKSIARQLDQQNHRGTTGTEPWQMANRVVQSLPPVLTKQALDTYSSCGCRGSTTRSSMYSLQLGNFSVFSRKQMLSRHERTCPLHAVTQEQTREAGARVRLQLGSFLSYLVEANFQCRNGQGGCAFGPSVRWKNIVLSSQSPVQRELNRVVFRLVKSPSAGRGLKEAEVVDLLKTMKQNVLTLYKTGQASVNDVDEENRNHLQNFIHVLLQSPYSKLLTHEVVDVAISMIRFYIETGLTCDERDWHFVTRSMAPLLGFLPAHSQTFTTLAKSAKLLLPSGGKNTYQRVRLISSIARASDPIIEDVVKFIPYMDPGILFTQIVDHETCLEKISPVAKAILIRSLKDLESAIRLSPESLLERTQGLTVLHLSIGWPPGLSLLLGTNAKLLLDTPDDISETPPGRVGLAWPFSYAAASHCTQSLDLLLQAGCNLYPENPEVGNGSRALACAMEVTSTECAEVFARQMAQRRRELFALARSNMGKMQISIHRLGIEENTRREFMATIMATEHRSDPGQSSSDATEPRQRVCLSEHYTSNLIVWVLEHAEIQVPVSLQPSQLIDHDVYQLSGLPLIFFPIFERHGFAGYNEPNRYGLRPIMDDVRSLYCISRASFGEEIQDVLPWLIQHECLDARPARIKEQPQPGFVISTGATGWHYLSMEFVHRTWGLQSWDYSINDILFEANTNFIVTIAEGQAIHALDGCVCWCIMPQKSGHGCSPFSYLCKHYLNDWSTRLSHSHNFQHHLFRHRRNDRDITTSTSNNEGNVAAPSPIPTWQLEFLRLLTFEALEITHACCTTLPIRSSGIEKAIFVATTDPEETQRQLLADPSVQEKVQLLNELMVEFTEQLGQKTGSPRDLEEFVFGPWRAQIAGLYDVDAEEVESLERVLGGKVQTKVLPEPLQTFFGRLFPFFDHSPATTLYFGPTLISPRKECSVDRSLSCKFCSSAEE